MKSRASRRRALREQRARCRARTVRVRILIAIGVIGLAVGVSLAWTGQSQGAPQASVPILPTGCRILAVADNEVLARCPEWTDESALSRIPGLTIIDGPTRQTGARQ